MRYIPTSKLFQGTAIFVVMLGAVFAPQIRHAVADGKSGDETKGNPTTRQYNDRLPPILPGEQVVTETGQKMHVWSSSGPVPVNPQPTPQQLPSGLGGAGVGVIVDGRADRDYREVGDGPDPARYRPR
jgi:hypothetical protein